MNTAIVLILFVLLLATAIVIARLKDLFAAAMLTGIFSLVSAGRLASIYKLDLMDYRKTSAPQMEFCVFPS